MSTEEPKTVEDDFDFLGDIEAPVTIAAAPRVLEDECGNTAFKFCFVGLGQAGGRMVEAFWKLGYRRVAAINTAHQDLDTLDIPKENQLLLTGTDGLDGAGKDMTRAKEIADQGRERILDHLLKCGFDANFDRVLVCLGTGGGTGGGTSVTVLEVIHELLESMQATSRVKVGVMASLPATSEGRRVCANACECLDHLLKSAATGRGREAVRAISPLILVDNSRISKLYPGVSAGSFWASANSTIARMFHLYNKTAATVSSHTSFDSRDYQDVLDSGLITFGSCNMASWENPTDISDAIRQHLASNVLVANTDLRSASVAGCVFIGSERVMDQVPQDHLEQGFKMLDRMMGGGSTVHRGVYSLGPRNSLTAYTILGGLNAPVETTAALAKHGEWWPSLPGAVKPAPVDHPPQREDVAESGT